MKFKRTDFFLALIIFILAFGLLSVAFKPGFLPKGTEIIEKRTYTSKTYSNGDGLYYSDFTTARIHFFDGFSYQPIENFSSPKIVKEDIVLQEKPNNLQCEFKQFPVGNFILAKGITPVLKDNQISFNDAKNTTIFSLTVPHSFDAKMSKVENIYRMTQEGQKLNIWMDVSCDWLTNAEYPLIVDTDTNFNTATDTWMRKPSTGASTSCALAQINNTFTDKSTDYNVSVGYSTNIGGNYSGLRRGFVEFDTSTLNGTSLNAVKLFYKITTGSEGGFVNGPTDINIFSSGNGTACWGASIDLNDWTECIYNEGVLTTVSVDLGTACTGTGDPANNDTCPIRSLSLSTIGINTSGNTQYKIMSEDENRCDTLAANSNDFIMIDSLDDPDTNHMKLQVTYDNPVPEFSLMTGFLAAIITFSVMIAFAYRRKE
ncbi:MAG: hypothetical protein Q7S21_00175 [archaeon]|nr:hypothetical protein [archaeon]